METEECIQHLRDHELVFMLFVWDYTQTHSCLSIKQFLMQNINGEWQKSYGIQQFWWLQFYKLLKHVSVESVKVDLSSFHSRIVA